jgi:uncharacterized protein YkwD
MRRPVSVGLAALAAIAVWAAYSLAPGAASSTNKYDVTNDGSITIGDALYCVGHEGERGPGLPCDVDGNSAVSIADVLAIVARIGPPATTATSTPTRTNTPAPSSTPTRTPTATPFSISTPLPSSTPVASQCSVDAASIALDPEERAFLTLINSYRSANGAPPLAISYTLTKSSAWKSHDMGANGYFGHDDLNRTWSQRVHDCGYTASGYIGENIAAGYVTAQAVFDAWKNSPDHNANMLNGSYRAIGIGREYVPAAPYGWYWTTDFGGVADGTGGL